MIGSKLGEGSFGVVYSGAFLPKNVKIENRTSKVLELDGKDKVILKKVTLYAMIFCGCFKLVCGCFLRLRFTLQKFIYGL